jgi:hypothetical protein
MAASFCGCSFYHRPYPAPPVATPAYELRVIQADDVGSLWSVPDANEVLAHIADTVQEHNAFIVVFIHGWHHNADPDDDNLLAFRDKLAQIAAQLHQPGQSQVRQRLTGEAETRVIGVYVGWRGRSLPGVLDYATMWWRKAAAERVGDGDAREFIERLQRIYLRTNTRARVRAGEPLRHQMGLVTIGHSFGGQVLLKAVGRALEQDLIPRAPALPDELGPRPPPGTTPEHEPIDSFGDLNVLLNPATEAYQFARIDRLYRQLQYPRCQTPQLVVFSADDDTPRAAYFPIARLLTRPFRPGFRNAEQATLWSSALGVLEEQQTHSLRRLPGDRLETASLADADLRERDALRRIQDRDLTARTVFGHLLLEPLPAVAPIANSPVAVVLTHDDIIVGHNGIFQADFWDFLVEYIGFVEAKRMLWLEQWRNAPHDSTSRPCD